MLIKRKYLFGTTILAGVMAVAAPALAQTPQAARPQQPQDERTSQSSNTHEATQIGEVIVTGTRIRNPEYTAASAVQVLTAENAEARGIPDVAQALLNSTLAVSSFQLNDQLTGYVTAGGGGTQSVALRGAGPQRTLTLLNGRRAGPAGTRGQVQAFDLGVIPGGVLERTEILKDGASSIYGSDAVAGVINIITRRDLDGGSMNAFYSQPFEGGGQQLRLDASFGRTFDRGYFNIAAEYSKTYIQRRGDRDYTSCTMDLLRDPSTGQPLDYIDPFTGNYKCYNLNTNYVSLLGSGQNIVRMQSGYTYPTAAQGNNVRADLAGEWARFNRAGYQATYQYTPSDHPLWKEASVISPAERQSIFLSGGFDLTNNVELYGEFLYNNRESRQVGVAQVFQSFAQRNIVNGAPNNLPASNPNNPFGEAVQTVSPYASSSFQNIDYYRGVLGLRGTFGEWDWDVYGQYSLSDADYNNGPRIYLDRFLALNSPNVACTNNPLGGNVSNFDCAALPAGIPWTSARVLAGNFTDAERNFLFFTENNTTTYEHAYIEGTISTPSLFTLPAGDVGAAFGVQYRKEEIDDTPGAQAILRNTALYTTSGRTAGSDTIMEAFGELDIPLLANIPWFDDLRLNVSGRLSDYESYGNSETYKVGLNWAVTPEVRFRSSYGTSFRAPALFEQFLGAQVGYQGQSAADPCYNYTENDTIDPAVLAGCIRDGANTTLGGSSVAVSSVGGRGVLSAETADNFTVGFVLTPQTMPISLAVDYYEFTVKDAVSQLGAYEIITRCYQGRTAFCDLYTRVGAGGPDAGRLATVNNSYTNVSEQNNRGVDVQVRWSEEYSFGRLTIESAHSFKLEDSEVVEGETTRFDGRTFNLGGPAYAGNVYLTLSRGDFSYFYGVDIIGSGNDVNEQGGVLFANSKYANIPGGNSSANCQAAVNYCVLYDFETPVWTTHSASIRYTNDNGWTASVGIQNLWDESPPIMGTGNFRVGTAALNGYDMRGRRMSLRIGRRF